MDLEAFDAANKLAAKTLQEYAETHPQVAEQLLPVIAKIQSLTATMTEFMATVPKPPEPITPDRPSDPKEFLRDFVESHRLPEPQVEPLVRSLLGPLPPAADLPKPVFDNSEIWEDWDDTQW